MCPLTDLAVEDALWPSEFRYWLVTSLLACRSSAAESPSRQSCSASSRLEPKRCLGGEGMGTKVQGGPLQIGRGRASGGGAKERTRARAHERE